MSKHGPITAQPMSWAECAAAGISKAEAARHRGASKAAATYWQKRRGVEFADGRAGASRKRTQTKMFYEGKGRSALRNVTRETLEAVWSRNDISVQKIADTLGVSVPAVYGKAKQLGLPKRGCVKKQIDDVLFSHLWMYGVCGDDLAAHFGYAGRSRAYDKARRLGLKRPTRGSKAKPPAIQEGIDAFLAIKMQKSAEATKLAAAKRAKKARA